jgi:hypothetical protein
LDLISNPPFFSTYPVDDSLKKQVGTQKCHRLGLEISVIDIPCLRPDNGEKQGVRRQEGQRQQLMKKRSKLASKTSHPERREKPKCFQMLHRNITPGSKHFYFPKRDDRREVQ